MTSLEHSLAAAEILPPVVPSAVDEWVDVESLPQRAALLAGLINAL